MSKYTVDGVRYSSAKEAERARRRKVLENIAANKGIKSKLWNAFASKKQKDQAAADLASMRAGGSGYRTY